MLATTIHHFWDRDASDKKKTVKKLKFPDPFQIYGCEYNINRDDLFSYLTDFSYFPLNFPQAPPIPESCRTWSDQVKNLPFRGGGDANVFSYFSLIFNYFIFY